MMDAANHEMPGGRIERGIEDNRFHAVWKQHLRFYAQIENAVLVTTAFAQTNPHARQSRIKRRDDLSNCFGQIATSDSLRDTLESWLFTYCIGNDDADSSVKARHPLRSASVDVREIPGRPGVYGCVMRLQPHFQLDDVTASFQLLADMNSKSDQSSRGKAL
jgi:hypothetical protein